jgi:hypothetical protein
VTPQAIAALTGVDTGLARDAVGEMMDATQLYDMPDPEPGLEEGSIADLLLFNRILGD